MRYLKIASAINPSTDFIELNDFNGFLCTVFQNLGINRTYEFLTIKNRQFAVSNKPTFNRYNLTIEVLTSYNLYEDKYKQFVSFIDRNKKNGLRLYYRPYESADLRYCLCEIESLKKAEKRQPISLTLAQCSLWLGEEKKRSTSQVEQSGNFFSFNKDGDYYSVKFAYDSETQSYNVNFFNGFETETTIINNSYNEVPLNIKIYGYCQNPIISLYRKGESKPFKSVRIKTSVDENAFIEIKSSIADNGVWYENETTNIRQEISTLIDNSFGSPYIYIVNGEYNIKVTDDSESVCFCDIVWQEEYSE